MSRHRQAYLGALKFEFHKLLVTNDCHCMRAYRAFWRLAKERAAAYVIRNAV